MDTTTSAVTYLFVPADRPERFSKALASGADRVIIDLEDAVRPDAKASARAAMQNAQLDWSRVVIRINDAASEFFKPDCEALRTLPAAAVMLPKAQSPADLAQTLRLIGRGVQIIPQIETALGLRHACDLLAPPQVRRAAFGHLDFALDLGAEPDWNALLLARSGLVMQSRLAEADSPIDSVTPNIKDESQLRLEATQARRLGFGAKLLIHPAQIRPTAQAFAPSAQEVAWARRVIEAMSQARQGAASVDGKMIDKPVADAAQRILARAAAVEA